MNEDPILLFRYAPTLLNDDGSEIGFDGMEAIRRPYKRRAKLIGMIRTVGLTIACIALIVAGFLYVMKPGTAIFLTMGAFAAAAFFTLSPLLYVWTGLTRDLPPLPNELERLLVRLKSGKVVALCGSRTIATSQFRSSFAVLLTSDVDHDWAYAPDHRLKYLKQPIELRLPANSSRKEAVSIAPPIDVRTVDESTKVIDSSKVEKLATADPAAAQEKSTSVKNSQTDWLKRLKWQQVVYGVPALLNAEAFHGDNKRRVELAIRWGRAALRGKTSFKPSFSGAKRAVIEAISRQRDSNGHTFKIGLNGSDSDEWIKQLLVGRYHDGRIKDYLIGRPHFAFESTGAKSDNSSSPAPDTASASANNSK
jgi:hypothetical protein